MDEDDVIVCPQNNPRALVTIQPFSAFPLLSATYGQFFIVAIVAFAKLLAGSKLNAYRDKQLSGKGLAVMARPSFQATDEHREVVKTMSGYGLRHEDISKLLGISPKALRKHFRIELDLGAIEANSKVVGSLFKMATSGTNTAASLFWVKTRCWPEKLREGNASFETSPQIVILGE